MEHREEEEYAQGMGGRRANLKPFRTDRGLGRQLRLAGGEADVQETDAGRGRKGTLDGITPWAGRDMGAGQVR